MYGIGNFTWVTIPYTANYFYTWGPSRWEKWQNLTLGLRDLAEGLYTCNDMVKNEHAYISQRINLFQGSLVIWSYSFLQNVLAKILSINNIYRSMSVAID